MAKGTKKAKHWGVTVAIILTVILALALSLSVISRGFRDWSKLKPEQTEKPAEKEEQTGGLVMPEATRGNGIALTSARIAEEEYEDYGISPLADSGYSVTATVEPENATDKRVTWSVAWKNASSSWASGKTVTNYVTVTPTSSGALTASLSCSQAFGEVVVLKVASTADPSIAATREINYMKRATSFEFYPSTYAGGAGAITVDKTGANAASLVCIPQYGDGTVTGTVSIPSMTISFSEAYCNLSSYVAEAQKTVTSGAVISAARSKTFSNVGSNFELTWRDFYTATGAGIGSIGKAAENCLKSGIVNISKGTPPAFGKVTATIKITYDSVSETYTKEANITKIDASALTVNINSLSYTTSTPLTF